MASVFLVVFCLGTRVPESASQEASLLACKVTYLHFGSFLQQLRRIGLDSFGTWCFETGECFPSPIVVVVMIWYHQVHGTAWEGNSSRRLQWPVEQAALSMSVTPQRLASVP